MRTLNRTLNLRTLNNALNKSVNSSMPEETLPQDVSKDQFELFLRILKARHTSELADVPTEDIVKMFSVADSLCAMMSIDNIFTRNLSQKLESTNSVHRRRIL